MTKIHPAAIIEEGAELGEGVEVGAYSVIGPNVKLLDGVRVMPHVHIEGWTTVGSACVIYPFASIGTECQDLKYKGAKTYVEIGDRTIIREYVTVNSSTEEGETTRVGSESFIMAYCHIAHKCSIGSGVIMANCAQLCGHVTIEDFVGVGGMVGVHQFVRIGTMSFVGGFSRIAQDVPPYFLVEGTPAVARGINSVGLRRRNVPGETRGILKEAFRLLCREGLSTTQAVERIRAELTPCKELDGLVKFVEASERGIIK